MPQQPLRLVTQLRVIRDCGKARLEHWSSASCGQTRKEQNTVCVVVIAIMATSVEKAMILRNTPMF